MEITKREIIFSIAIVAVMLAIGFFISDKISDWQNDKNAEYQKAIHIEDSEMFRYGMDTSIGNAFIYGDLVAVDTVSYPEVGGKYMYIEKVKERYTMHTRQVPHTRTVNGRTQTYYTTEIYWTWDTVGKEELLVNEISFCGEIFPVEKIHLPSSDHIGTIRASSDIRYQYYGVGIEHTGTIFTNLRDGTISDNSRFFKNCTITDALDICTSGVWAVIFWGVWIILICAVVCGFYYLENRWLEQE